MLRKIHSTGRCPPNKVVPHSNQSSSRGPFPFHSRCGTLCRSLNHLQASFPLNRTPPIVFISRLLSLRIPPVCCLLLVVDFTALRHLSISWRRLTSRHPMLRSHAHPPTKDWPELTAKDQVALLHNCQQIPRLLLHLSYPVARFIVLV